MDYTERLQNVSVLGAAGKMGSGILLLTAIEMADLSLKPENRNKHFVLYAMDVSSEALRGLMKYLKTQVLKIAEKKIVALREVYADRADLITNEQIINQYIEDVLFIVRPVTAMEATYDSHIIFEAIKEDPALKVKVFKQIDQNSKTSPWFCTNTSSIPINEIESKAELNGRVLGVHFYNPPAVQRLVEIIKTQNTQQELVDFAYSFSKNLRKIIVPSADVAGFIGNGHFMRDALHGIQEAEELAGKYSFAESVYMINRISQEFLIRPMGIFQLIDYVGIDVCSYIMSVMNPYMKNENLHSSLLDKMIEQGIKGGQNPDGSQKDGFLKYEKGKPVAIYDVNQTKYISGFQQKCDKELGALPSSIKPWKAVVGDKNKEEFLVSYFNELKSMDSLGATLAKKYAKRSREIGLQLVSDKVAHSKEDVNTVLLTGFFHAYGPINDYM
ncbi:MAG: 3-hydroxyacyl-CoA dehydrogenase family protein [Bacteroidetes bacterium]|nr:MAG: 3-hydroxyacyl-CoA dehydrogenase family protein [Bacteroidota bacterium]